MKMNKLCIFFIITITILGGCKRIDHKFELSGNIIGDTTGIVVLTQVGQSRLAAETSPIIGGKFHIIGNLDYPEEFSLMTEKPNQRQFRPIRIFIAPNDKIEIELNTEDIKKSVIKGSFVNDEFQRYLNLLKTDGDDQLDLLGAEFIKAVEIKDTFRINELRVQGDVLNNELNKIRTQRAYE